MGNTIRVYSRRHLSFALKEAQSYRNQTLEIEDEINNKEKLKPNSLL